MSSISGVSGVSDASALEASNTTTYGGQDLDRDAFMSLLTTQMQNQDPLSPMANEEFIAQLATFSSLEQLMGLNTMVQSVSLGINSLNNAAMVDLVGQSVVAEGDTFAFDGESQELMFDAESTTTSTTVTIYDEDGSVVFSEDIGAMEEGESSWTWDGTDQDGQPVEEGTYTFEVTGVDADGEDVEITELIHGIIDEMDFSSGSPEPSVDGIAVDLSALVRLTTAEEAEEAEEEAEAADETVEETSSTSSSTSTADADGTT